MRLPTLFSVVLLGCNAVMMANDNLQLMITTRPEILKGVLAGIHAFSQIELLNIHPSEPVIIHSVTVAQEQTELNGNPIQEPIPQQIHASRVEALRLDPGAVAVVPLSFLPRYPHDEVDMPENSSLPQTKHSDAPTSEMGRTPHRLSSYQHSDLAALVGEEALAAVASPSPTHQAFYRSERRRNNLEYNDNVYRKNPSLYEVHTSVIIESSRGRTIIPLSASSMRVNHYRVPERIRFRPPPIASLWEANTGSPISLQTVDRSGGEDVSGLPSSDCYDLYIYNPRTDPLHVSELTLSKLDAVALFHVIQGADLKNHTKARSRKEWGSSVKVVKHGETQYLATICPLDTACLMDLLVKPERSGDPWAIQNATSDLSLGYLQVKTDEAALFVFLEWHMTVDYLQWIADRLSERDKIKMRQIGPSKSKLRASPESLTADLIPFVSTREKVVVSILNTASVAMKVMRVSLFVEQGKSNVLQDAGIKFQLTCNLEPVCDSTIDLDHGTEYRQCEEKGIIYENTTWIDSLTLEVRIESNLTMNFLKMNDGFFHVNGSIIVTATTDIGASYQMWIGAMKRNPYNQEKVVLEIPWTIRLIDGRIYALLADTTAPNTYLRHEFTPVSIGKEAVDAFFFPFEQLDLREWTYWPGVKGRMYDYDPDGVSHTVRIISLSKTQLKITKLRIERDENDPQSSVCGRFQAKVVDPLPSQLRGWNQVGVIRVDYSYNLFRDRFRRREGKGEIQNVVYPTICRLTFETIPVNTGEHVIDLVVFTGKLDVSTGDAGMHVRSNGVSNVPSTSRGREHIIAANLVVGFDRAISWLDANKVGSTLLKHLRRKSMFGRWTSAASLFREYIRNLANFTEDGTDGREGFIDPIILHAGPIAHGETITMPLHFTNFNPVPVQVFVDVGEVEGMSISISRATSRLRGDGNSMLDFLPNDIHPRFDRIVHGAWASHSRNGLKNFLVQSDLAQSFFNFFPHRDAIEVSARATASLPLLRSLYKKRAKSTFHADMHSLSFYSEKMNGCDGDEKSPSSYVNINDRVQGWPGPLLLSDDGIVAHSNTICDPDFLPDISSFPRSTNMMYLKQTPVTIPPGGVARFDVKVRAPEKDSLSKDVSAFLSTGLLISTDHGQISPIIVTFEALLGQLKLSHGLEWTSTLRSWQKHESFSHQFNGEVLDVPMKFFQTLQMNDCDRNATAITIPPSSETPSTSKLTTWMPPSESSVPLFLSSSFSRNVVLRDIESCNPWFRIDLKKSNSIPEKEAKAAFDADAVEIGTLRTAITCPTMQDLLDTFHEIEIPDYFPLYSSFYQCALEWLENRTLLQGYGCGTRPMPKTLQQADFGAEEYATERALDALNHAITFSMFKYGNGRLKYDSGENGRNLNASLGDLQLQQHNISSKTGGARGNALVDRLTLDVYSEITDAWKAISKLDLHSVTSSFRATLEYSYAENVENQNNDEAEPQSLTVSMRDVAIRTKLSIPQLLKQKDHYMYGRIDQEDDFFSVFEFPPTAVADVASLMLPLENPTGIPVKVRLASISWEEIARETQKSDDFRTLATDEVREQYLKRFESIFTQTGLDSPGKTPGDSWWEGHGGFFHADEQGHLVQSLHNMSIFVGSKAKVALINPSLFSQSAFTIGCGTRCGLRDEGSSGDKFMARLRKRSPIGASAAAGASLVGKPRISIDKDDRSGEDEPALSAGGTVYADSAPAAFAIPYSGFDEIILPPYGKAEVGPILFRPPGRYGLMGCDSILDNDAIPFGEKIAETCSSTVFQSMILLENSLTGLERVVLRGKALWESVVFLDPIENDSLDAFGDLELRHGKTTLVFPGSAVSSRHVGLTAHPVIKGVVIQNDGDEDVEFSRVFFIDNNFRKHERIPKPSNHGCSYRGFRLLGCFECDQTSSNKTSFEGKSRRTRQYEINLYDGFRLPAGSNKTIFVEHSPDCAFRSEYVVLNFEFKRDPSLKLRHGRNPLPFLPPVHGRATSDGSDALRCKNLQLNVGFEMTPSALKKCVAVKTLHPDAVYLSGSQDVFSWNDEPPLPTSQLNALRRAVLIGRGLRLLVHSNVGRRYLPSGFLVAQASVLAAALFIAIVAGFFGVRLRSANFMRRKIQAPRCIKGRSESFEGTLSLSNWSSTFRCLARADPTSSELQTISREQVKEIVLHRFKGLGVISPQCIDSSGSFNRDGGAQKPRNGKGGSSTMQTLSDAMFHRCVFTPDSESEVLAMPCGLGWRSTIGRRIVQGSQRSTFKLRSAILRKNRSKALAEEEGSTLPLANPETAKPRTTLQRESILNELESSDPIMKYLEDEVTVESLNQGPVEDITENSSVGQPPGLAEQIQNKDAERIHQTKDSVLDSEGSAGVVLTITKEKKIPQHRSKGNRPSNASQDSSANPESKAIHRNSRHRDSNVSATGSASVSKDLTSSKRNKTNGRGKQKATTQRSEGAPSSPSSIKSLSSRSAKTDTTASPNLTPIEAKRTHLIRPPPGLAPPPGFGGLDSASALDVSTSSIFGQSSIGDLTYPLQNRSAQMLSLDLNLSQLHKMRSDSSAALDQLYSTSSPTNMALNSSSLFDRIRATEERKFEASPTSVRRESVASMDSSAGLQLMKPAYASHDDSSPINGTRSSIPQLDSSTGFDVMGFLDSLLDESGNEDSGGNLDRVPSHEILYTPLLDDPWAFERRSIPSMYGMLGRDTLGNGKEDDPGIVQAILASSPSQDGGTNQSALVIPLLTPAVLGQDTMMASEDDDKIELPHNDYDNGDFYARLLGE